MNKVLLLLIAALLNQNLVSCLVTDYNVTIWNSQGYRLQQVLDSFLSNPSLILALVQESGNVASENPGQLIHQNLEVRTGSEEGNLKTHHLMSYIYTLELPLDIYLTKIIQS